MTTQPQDQFVLGLLVAVPTGAEPLQVGGLPVPVRLLRQFRKAGAEGPAFLVLAGDEERSRWGDRAFREGALALSADALPDAIASAQVHGWICAPGDLVFSGEGLTDALAEGHSGVRAVLPDGTSAGWGIAPARILSEPIGDSPRTHHSLWAWFDGADAGNPPGPPWEGTLVLPAQKYCLRATDARKAKSLEAAVMAGLSRPQDPNFTRLSGRRISRWISRRLAAKGVSPNMMTATAILVGLAGAAMMAQAGYLWMLVGALVFAFSRILDDCDGELARITFRDSAFGAIFDVAGDVTVYAAVFLALGVGLNRADPVRGYLWATALLLFGMIVTTVLLLSFVTRTRAREESSVVRILERSASGDVAYIILAFALIGRPEWFLWAAAIGAQLYWMVLGVALAAWRSGATETEG